MAKKQENAEVCAFVLRDCGFGKVGQVVTLPEEAAKTGEAHGMLDLNAAAIAAAKKAE